MFPGDGSERDQPAQNHGRRERPTMRDIADKAGVSRTTVSLVLNERESRVSPDMQRLIREIATDLGFRPSHVALQLRTQRSGMIGFVGDRVASGPFAGGLIAGAQSAAARHAFALMVMNTGAVGYLGKSEIQALEDRDADGIVFATEMTRHVGLPDELPSAPIVLLNCFSDSAPVGQIVPDDRRGGRRAAEMALEAGHRRIALLTAEAGSFPADERLGGYKEALVSAGIPFDPNIVRFGDWTAGTGYTLTQEMLGLRTPPTAVLCGNDRMALGAFEAIRDLNLRIPDDVSVIGYDDQQEIAAFTHPPLTTIHLPYQRMGELAIQALVENDNSRQWIECVPVIRGSLGAAR